MIDFLNDNAFVIIITMLLIMMFPVLSFGILGYFLPSIIALISDKKNIKKIIICNVLFGWFIIGWIICLVFAILMD